MRRCLRCRTPLLYDGVGRPRKYCVDCTFKIEKEKSLDYRLKNREKIRLRARKFRKEHPDKVHEWYRKNYVMMSELKRKARDKVYDDVLNHPRKWLKKVTK